MFSKKILEEDIQYLESLQKQQAKCLDLIKSSYKDVLDKNLNEEELELEKSSISALQDQYDNLHREVGLLKEQMYLNYTNTITISKASAPAKKIPHINTIIR